jgi:uncharacterized protein (TIGR02246 family)
MKQILLLAALVVAASSIALGQTPATPTATPTPAQGQPAITPGTPTAEKVAANASAEQAVRQLDQDLMGAMAKNDTALFERVATDDYTATNPIGMNSTKAQAIAGAKNFKFESLNTDDVNVRTYGDTAIVTGRATVKGQLKTAADKMQDISGQYRYIRVYVKQGDQWRVAASQLTPIAQPPMQHP